MTITEYFISHHSGPVFMIKNLFGQAELEKYTDKGCLKIYRKKIGRLGNHYELWYELTEYGKSYVNTDNTYDNIVQSIEKFFSNLS